MSEVNPHAHPACAFAGLLLLTSVAAFSADQPGPVPGAAPIPLQIGTGKRIFVSNMGGECQNFKAPGLFGPGQALHHGQISASVPMAYDGLYAALNAWGRFQLVLAPAEADLILQIRVVCPSIQEGHPVLELQILDPHTRISLWGFSEIAGPAQLQKNRDTNFELALARLVTDIKTLFGRADSAAVTSTR